MIAALIGLVGLAFAANGAAMLPDIQSAMQQTVSTLYMVGGVIVFALAMILSGVQSLSDHLKADLRSVSPPTAPQPVAVKATGDAPPSPSTRGDGWICGNCGRTNTLRLSVCPCGMGR